jgi:hypothetical protein
LSASDSRPGQTQKCCSSYPHGQAFETCTRVPTFFHNAPELLPQMRSFHRWPASAVRREYRRLKRIQSVPRFHRRPIVTELLERPRYVRRTGTMPPVAVKVLRDCARPDTAATHNSTVSLVFMSRLQGISARRWSPRCSGGQCSSSARQWRVLARCQTGRGD